MLEIVQRTNHSNAFVYVFLKSRNTVYLNEVYVQVTGNKRSQLPPKKDLFLIYERNKSKVKYTMPESVKRRAVRRFRSDIQLVE